MGCGGLAGGVGNWGKSPTESGVSAAESRETTEEFGRKGGKNGRDCLLHTDFLPIAGRPWQQLTVD